MRSAEVRALVNEQPNQVRSEFFRQCTRKLKDDDTYVALCWWGGGVGFHRFYLGHWGRGLLHLIMGPIGLLLLIGGVAGDGGAAGVGVLFLITDFIMWLGDLILYRRVVNAHNAKIEYRIYKRLARKENGTDGEGVHDRGGDGGRVRDDSLPGERAAGEEDGSAP